MYTYCLEGFFQNDFIGEVKNGFTWLRLVLQNDFTLLYLILCKSNEAEIKINSTKRDCSTSAEANEAHDAGSASGTDFLVEG